MKIVCISNVLNHHTKPICDELFKKNEKKFVFIATGSYAVNKLKGGSEKDFLDVPYLLQTDNNTKNVRLARKLCFEADVLIQQDASDSFIRERLKKNKLTFRVSERIFKGKKNETLRRIKYTLRNLPYRNKNLFLLAAGGYTSYDMRKCFSFKNKSYKWGYFPGISKVEDHSKVCRANGKLKFTWVGRFIEWKHPEICLIVATYLQSWNIDFEINMIGEGIAKEGIMEQVHEQGLQDKINFLGELTNVEVQKYMADSIFFIFSSDKKEGWGAVLNEAMAQGAIPIASHEPGSVPFLIENNKNGYIYEQGNINSLEKVLRKAVNDKEQLNEISMNAQNTILNVWSAENAANNLLKLIDKIKQNSDKEIKEGPGSDALPIDERTFLNNYTNIEKNGEGL